MTPANPPLPLGGDSGLYNVGCSVRSLPPRVERMCHAFLFRPILYFVCTTDFAATAGSPLAAAFNS